MRVSVTSISVAALLLSAIPGVASAYTAQKIQVTSDPADQSDPSVSNGKVAWTDRRSGNADIWLFDIPTKTYTRLTSDPGNEFLADISGNTVVYTTDRNGNLDIYDVVLGNPAENAVTTESHDQSQPAVSDSYFVWTDARTTYPNVFFYDRATASAGAVDTVLAPQQDPAVSGTVVVWNDLRNIVGNIWARDLASGSAFPITSNVASSGNSSSSPDIDGKYVVFITNGDVYYVDLTDAALTPHAITSGGSKANPHISGTFVVWEDHSGADVDLYGYDIATNQTMPLATGPGDQQLHDVSGYDLAYTDNASGNNDIWVMHVDTTTGNPNVDPCDPSSGAPVYYDGTFTRQTGHPHEQHATFAVSDGATDGTICVDVDHVASATVELNEVHVLNPDDFNMNVTSLERAVTLQANNELEVTVRGKPHHHDGQGGDGDGDCDHHHGGNGDGCCGGGHHHDGHGDDGGGCGSGNSGDGGTLHIRVVGPVPAGCNVAGTARPGAESVASLLFAAGAIVLSRKRRSR